MKRILPAGTGVTLVPSSAFSAIAPVPAKPMAPAGPIVSIQPPQPPTVTLESQARPAELGVPSIALAGSQPASAAGSGALNLSGSGGGVTVTLTGGSLARPPSEHQGSNGGDNSPSSRVEVRPIEDQDSPDAKKPRLDKDDDSDKNQ